MWGQVEHVLTMADLEKNTSLFTPRPNHHSQLASGLLLTKYGSHST